MSSACSCAGHESGGPGSSNSLHFSPLQIIQNGGMETLGEITDKYPRAFPFWLGPFQAFFFIYDPDYAKTLLSRPGKKGMDLGILILLGVICTAPGRSLKGLKTQRLALGLSEPLGKVQRCFPPVLKGLACPSFPPLVQTHGSLFRSMDLKAQPPTLAVQGLHWLFLVL